MMAVCLLVGSTAFAQHHGYAKKSNRGVSHLDRLKKSLTPYSRSGNENQGDRRDNLRHTPKLKADTALSVGTGTTG